MAVWMGLCALLRGDDAPNRASLGRQRMAKSKISKRLNPIIERVSDGRFDFTELEAVISS